MTAPVLTDLDGVTFTEGDVNAAPRLIDSDVTFTDLDGHVAGGVLTVSGLKAEDVVSLWNQGTAAGQIGFDSGTGQITWGGVVIGAASGGAGGTSRSRSTSRPRSPRSRRSST